MPGAWDAQGASVCRDAVVASSITSQLPGPTGRGKGEQGTGGQSGSRAQRSGLVMSEG